MMGHAGFISAVGQGLLEGLGRLGFECSRAFGVSEASGFGIYPKDEGT